MKERDSGTFPKRPRAFFYLLVFAGLALLATGGLLVLFLSSLFIPAMIMIGFSIALMAGLGAHYAFYTPPHIVMSEKADAQIGNSTPVVEGVVETLEQPAVQVTLEDKTTSTLTSDEKTNQFNPPLFNQPEKQTIASSPPMIRPQIEAALRGYSGSGPLKIYLFTAKEIKLIQALTKPKNEGNTAETIERVDNYIRGKFLENSRKYYGGEYNKRYIVFNEWLKEIIPAGCEITTFSFSSFYEDTPVELDEKDALELRRKYTLPDTEVDLIAEALNNPVYSEDCLLIPFLSDPELSFIYKGLDHKCGVSKRHPAVLEITSSPYETMLGKIQGIMENAELFDMFNGTIGLDKNQVEEFKERYFASTQATSHSLGK